MFHFSVRNTFASSAGSCGALQVFLPPPIEDAAGPKDSTVRQPYLVQVGRILRNIMLPPRDTVTRGLGWLTLSQCSSVVTRSMMALSSLMSCGLSSGPGLTIHFCSSLSSSSRNSCDNKQAPWLSQIKYGNQHKQLNYCICISHLQVKSTARGKFFCSSWRHNIIFHVTSHI